VPLIRKAPDQPPPASGAAADLFGASPDARWAAARCAAGQPELVPHLARALAGERNENVRQAIVTSLVCIGTAEAAASLLPHLRSDEANLRTIALDGLRAMPELAKACLRDLLEDADPDVRLLACDLARDLPGRDVPALLCSLLGSDESPAVCAAAIEALVEIGDATAIPALELCAARFRDDPFLPFAIDVALERLDPRGGRD
jgi:HEAT repeat protein